MKLSKANPQSVLEDLGEGICQLEHDSLLLTPISHPMTTNLNIYPKLLYSLAATPSHMQRDCQVWHYPAPPKNVQLANEVLNIHGLTEEKLNKICSHGVVLVGRVPMCRLQPLALN